MTDVTDDLAIALFALDEGRLSTGEMTARITQAIVEWATAHAWAVRTEARINPAPSLPSDSRIGFVDVVVRRGGGQPDLAIEIDSADKPWSVTKLLHAVAGGMHGIWVRWGDEAWAGIYDEIDVIQLPALRRAARRERSMSQLALWP